MNFKAPNINADAFREGGGYVGIPDPPNGASRPLRAILGPMRGVLGGCGWRGAPESWTPKASNRAAEAAYTVSPYPFPYFLSVVL